MWNRWIILIFDCVGASDIYEKSTTILYERNFTSLQFHTGKNMKKYIAPRVITYILDDPNLFCNIFFIFTFQTFFPFLKFLKQSSGGNEDVQATESVPLSHVENATQQTTKS